MSEELSTDNTPEADTVTAGQLLRQAREAHGLHVAALAVSLKVPVKKLEALEADRLSELHDAVFIRALASSVCRALKVDSQPILAKLPQTNTRVLDRSEANIPVKLSTRTPGTSRLSGVNKNVAFGVLALLLGAIVLMLLPDFASRTAKSEASKTETVKPEAGVSLGAAINVPSTTDTAASSVKSADAKPIEAKPDVKPSDANTTVSLSSASTPTVSTPNVPSPTLTISPLKASDVLASVSADSLVVMRASSETWIEVRDVGGKVTLQKTLAAGEQAGASGRPPLKVTIGRAIDTQVLVRGVAFDLKPVTNKEGVARFAVK